ncbi:hypothetical protein Acr_00g0082510 [Actinidia rufa]|uniref:Uncharacterized protein n=1 Tax=Actinidia rufa TaxID=165716 RepID=A0A7J0DVX7_9ERIC|nr:hypothetical protein Acr_00g0082510 [Actinidia rufa]
MMEVLEHNRDMVFIVMYSEDGFEPLQVVYPDKDEGMGGWLNTNVIEGNDIEDSYYEYVCEKDEEKESEDVCEEDEYEAEDEREGSDKDNNEDKDEVPHWFNEGLEGSDDDTFEVLALEEVAVPDVVALEGVAVPEVAALGEVASRDVAYQGVGQLQESGQNQGEGLRQWVGQHQGWDTIKNCRFILNCG